MPNKETIHAQIGTAAHEVLSMCIEDMYEPSDFIGDVIEGIKIDSSIANGVEKSLAKLMELWDELQFDYDRVIVTSENEVDLSFLGVADMDGGTADVIIECYNDNDLEMLYVIDYKNGFKRVDAIENSQMLMYAIGAVNKVGKRPKHIKLGILQPNCIGKELLDVWPDEGDEPLTYKELLTWQKKELIPAAKATKNPDAPLVPSESACFFCLAQGKCPALLELNKEILQTEFETITPTEKLWVLQSAPIVKAFINAVEGDVFQEIMDGSLAYEDDFKLVYGITHRKWQPNAEETITDILGDKAVKKQVSLKGMGDIESMLVKACGKKKSAKVMKDVTFKPEPSLTMAPISDRRAKQQPLAAAEEDFEELY